MPCSWDSSTSSSLLSPSPQAVNIMPDPPVIPTSVAVIGSGAAGLGAAWLLARGGYAVHLFESRETAGGHAYTIDVPIPGHPTGATVPVDAGFIVYNSRTYPDIVSLFQMLNVEEENSTMSFAASIQVPSREKYFEWGSDSLAALFADRENLYRPSMYTMLYDMRRFNNGVFEFLHKMEKDPEFKDKYITLGEFLENGSYSTVFIRCYLIPMIAAVWSASTSAALAFPARTLFHFFANHNLAQVFGRPQWRTPSGRSRDYVTKIVNDIREHSGIVLLGNPVKQVIRDAEGVTVWSEACDPKRFDHVVFATHPPDTLKLLGDDATDDEKMILGAFHYSDNQTFIHHDASLMPTNRDVWSAWNFIGRSRKTQQTHRTGGVEQGGESVSEREETASESERHTNEEPSGDGPDESRNPVEGDVAENGEVPQDDDEPVCVSYWLNPLQNYHKYYTPVPDLFLTLNPVSPIDPHKILKTFTFAHPHFTEEAVKAQPLLQEVLQGNNRSWFCGAYTRFGFHEDAMMSGLDVAERLSGYKNLRPWKTKHRLVINDNSRPYEMPVSSLRNPLFVYLLALFVLNAVMERLREGLGKIAARMADDDPIVCVTVGNGRLHRFGPHRSRGMARAASSSTGTVALETARVTVRTPKFLARVTEALRQGHALAPTAAAAFAASECDCPTPHDLTIVLKSLFIADGLDLDPSKARKGRAKFAESLLFSIVGGFKKVTTFATHTRLPELTTCISNVVYPSWWLEVDRETSADGKSPIPTVSMVSPGDLGVCMRVLELLGDLSETTIAILQSNKDCTATIVLQTSERSTFVNRKAELLFVRPQIEIVLLETFVKTVREQKADVATSGQVPGPEEIGTVSQTLFDLILSPAVMNSFSSAGFRTLNEALLFLKEIATPDAIIELGATVYGCRPEMIPRKPQHRIDKYFSGDEKFAICQTRDLLEESERVGFELQRITFMDSNEAAMDVDEVVYRVYNSLAGDKLEPEETRAVLAQMCLWEAALLVKHIRRISVSFKLNTHPFNI